MDRIMRAVDGNFTRETHRGETFDLGGEFKRTCLPRGARGPLLRSKMREW
jgi:hypothetical protein